MNKFKTMLLRSLDLRYLIYITQVKEKCGIKERENYNKPKKEDLKQAICPIEKAEAIKDAFRYFKMI